VWINGKPYTTQQWMDEDIESSASPPARSYAEHRRNQSSITRNAAGDERRHQRRARGKADAAGAVP
jgi:hypothetical protein